MTRLKSRRKLRPMKVKGKVYDPMPRGPTEAGKVRATCSKTTYDRPNAIALNASNRNVRTFKSGKRRITFK